MKRWSEFFNFACVLMMHGLDLPTLCGKRVIGAGYYLNCDIRRGGVSSKLCYMPTIGHSKIHVL